jgi:hypothetical protein
MIRRRSPVNHHQPTPSSEIFSVFQREIKRARVVDENHELVTGRLETRLRGDFDFDFVGTRLTMLSYVTEKVTFFYVLLCYKLESRLRMLNTDRRKGRDD